MRRLARLLPDDLRVRAVIPVPAEFDARFGALRRHYRYRIATAPFGAEPLRARDTAAWPHPLDIDAVRAAAAPLLGEHDFRAFCRPREGATTVRELQRFAWSREDGQLVTAELTADAFCHSMVRSLVGALLDVGRGRRGVGWPAELLERAQRSSEVTVAPGPRAHPRRRRLPARRRARRAGRLDPPPPSLTSSRTSEPYCCFAARKPAVWLRSAETTPRARAVGGS